MIHIGIDMGGTKISAIALDEKGAELARERVPTPKDYESIVSTCAKFVQKFEQQAGQKSTVGVGSPGAIDTHEGLVRFSPNIPPLAGKFFARDLENKINTRVRLANDAMCFALSESVDGAGAGLNRVYGIILGTGVGGALVEAGRFVPGPNTFMEWGHLPLPFADEKDIPFPRCGCGRTGCIEAYLSGPALHLQLAEAIGRELTNNELNELMAKRMPLAMEVMDSYIRRLAKAFAMLITILDPDALVLGGGLSNLSVLYDEVPKRIGHYTPVTEIKTKILQAKYGDDSGLRGAAWLGSGKQ